MGEPFIGRNVRALEPDHLTMLSATNGAQHMPPAFWESRANQKHWCRLESTWYVNISF
jgi:hypothetical protein